MPRLTAAGGSPRGGGSVAQKTIGPPEWNATKLPESPKLTKKKDPKLEAEPVLPVALPRVMGVIALLVPNGRPTGVETAVGGTRTVFDDVGFKAVFGASTPVGVL